MPALRKNTKKSESALDRIAKLKAAVADEERKLCQLERERVEAGHEVKRRREAYIAALSRNESGAAELEALREADDRLHDDLDMRIEAQGRRVRDAERAVQSYVSENLLSAIGAEKLEKDRAARDRVVAAMNDLAQAIVAIQSESTASDEIVRLSGLPPRTEGAPVSLGLEQLADAVRHAQDAGVRLPSARRWSPENVSTTITLNEDAPQPAGFVA